MSAPTAVAACPQPDDRLTEALGWKDLLQRLAELCATALGRERALALRLLADPEAVQAELDVVAEARALIDAGEPLPLGGIWDLRQSLRRLEKEGALEGPTLIQVAQTLQAGSRLARFLRERREQAPRLARLGAALSPLDGVSGPILASFDEGGVLGDHASPDLRRLRRTLAEIHERLNRRMRGLMEAPHIARHLQDHFYTQREDRYVLPVRADAGPAVEGIVHGSSSSGATIFIEPQEVVGLNNELKVAEIAVLREESRVLAELSAAVGEEWRAIQENLAVLEALDVINARAQLAIRLDAHLPRLSRDGRLRLQAIRHPLMVLAGSQVVPNDVELGPGQALVISGPNAGGKTVCLKTLGLCALMVRAGMHLPAGSD
ncbi:MAG: endonuclease MutS2, partial [Anaerolineae bacterium]|nr:endonuclease MutS2 [Anaerolineae bacterium]